MAPIKVTSSNQREVLDNLYGKWMKKKIPKHYPFKFNDRVRLTKKFRPFKKGYLPERTEEIFVVRKVIPGMVTTYKVK